MPAPGYYKVYWRNPETRVFEAIGGVNLVDGRLAVTGGDSRPHWYTKGPGAVFHFWRKGWL